MISCSFCGKSQHAVRRLIAGPEAHICDECADLCAEINFEEGDSLEKGDDGRKSFGLAIYSNNSLTELDNIKYYGMLEVLKEAYPDFDFQLKGIVSQSSGKSIRIQVTMPISGNFGKEQNTIRRLAIKVKELEESYWAEKENRERAERALEDLKGSVFPIIMEKLRNTGEINNQRTETLAVLLLDIVGFSKMESAERDNIVGMLRLISKTVLGQADGLFMNTWGDAIVAGFRDVNIGLKCACKLLKHLEVEQISVRIAMSWGAVSVSYNDVTQREDILGGSINESARLEAIAREGSVYVTESIRFHSDLKESDFIFSEQPLKLVKGFADKESGSQLTAFAAILKQN